MSITLCTVARSGGKGNADKNMYKQNGPYGSQIFLKLIDRLCVSYEWHGMVACFVLYENVSNSTPN